MTLNICKTTHPVLLLVMVAAALWLTGCTQIFTGKKAAEPQTSTVSSSGSGVSDIQPTSPVSRKTTAVYYDFEDVLIPLELKVVQDKSVIVSTPGFTSGILVLKGRVVWLNREGEITHPEVHDLGMGIRFIFPDDASRESFEQQVGGLMRESLGDHLYDRLMKREADQNGQ